MKVFGRYAFKPDSLPMERGSSDKTPLTLPFFTASSLTKPFAFSPPSALPAVMTPWSIRDVRLRQPHTQQAAFLDSRAPRRIIRAGRRSGKTTGIAIGAVRALLERRRVLYATPTGDQIGRFWAEVTRALAAPLARGQLVKNETLHTIELPGTDVRIRAKTAWNADTLRGDYADLLIMDEWQLMDEQAWELVGAPMLLDNNGDAVFIYTPPSLHSRSVSKARDPRHAARMFAAAQGDESGRWAAFHFTSHDNPFISAEALAGIQDDMTALAIRQEILAEDLDEAPGALWTRSMLDATRVRRIEVPDLARIVVAVDPPGGATECGIVVVGKATAGAGGQRYVLADRSARLSPEGWADAIIDAVLEFGADAVIGESNYGGDMVRSTVLAAARSRLAGTGGVRYKAVTATRGKAVRAEPCAAAYERGEVHHAGSFGALEDELTMWVPGVSAASPNRLDALVWGLTELGGGGMTVDIL